MASFEVTGKTAEETARRRKEHDEKYPNDNFDKKYCLAKIPVQPEDYDGPPRFCFDRKTKAIGSNWRCKHHGGAGHSNPENMDKLANMTHGMDALRKHIRQSFDEKDAAIYEWIVTDYPEAYDINIEQSPADAYDIHRLAVEIVRAERGRGYLIDEGEVHEEEVRGEDGAVVVDNSGNVVTSKSQHYLARMLKDQDSKITSLQKELGITRKERQRANQTDDAVDVMKNFTEVGAAILNREENEYSSDDAPWEDDEE